jgi:hypothetical protein
MAVEKANSRRTVCSPNHRPLQVGASGPSRAIGSLAPGRRKMLISRIEPTIGDAASAMTARPRNRRAADAVARTAPRTRSGPSQPGTAKAATTSSAAIASLVDGLVDR